MNIKQVVDKINKEASVEDMYYTVEDRLLDVAQTARVLLEEATQIGSRFPISNATSNSEIFTVSVAGDAAFTRTIKDTGIASVEYRSDANSPWYCMDRDTERCRDCFSHICGLFKADEKRVYVANAYVGDYRVTYEKEAFTELLLADYNNVAPPSYTFLPLEFHNLLWLKPAINIAGKYKTERVESLQSQWEELHQLFESHYHRHAEFRGRVDTGDNTSRV